MASDGSTFPVEVTWRQIPYPDGQPAAVVAVRDLRERRRLEAELSRSAFYDGLTGLPNRGLLLDRVSHALSFIRPDEDGPIGFILLDLDRFKVINESLGHAAGDRLLEMVGRRLSECLRPGDTVARFGGDEFAVLLDSVRDVDDALHVAERMEAELRVPFDLDGRDTFVGASMGIALGRAGSTEPGELLRDAEIALYRAKADVTTRHALFEPGMSAAVAERLDLENDLRRAVERDELRLHYQPLVDLATGRIVGLEALVRWQHPTRGLVPPLAFIPLAEETGMILSIGRWVLETACRQARAWQVAFPTEPPILMSVNLSAKQFARADLVEQVSAILAETGLRPGCLELEITESVLMDESDAGIKALQALRDLGVKLVLDDFGTGYSSLSYLKHLPSTRSRSIARSWASSPATTPAWPSSGRSSPWPTAWASMWSPRGSRRPLSWPDCASWRATGARATTTPGRWPPTSWPSFCGPIVRWVRWRAPTVPAAGRWATGRRTDSRPADPTDQGDQAGRGFAAIQRSTTRSSRSKTTPSSVRAWAMKRSSMSRRWPRPIASGCIVIVSRPPGSRSQA